MASIITTHYDEALQSLARAIRKHRGAAPVDTARQLLAMDTPGHVHLVGIDYAATRTVYYHCQDRYAIAVSFDGEGLADGGSKVGSFQNRPL